MPKCPMVRVTWNDAYGSAGEQWFEGSDIEHSPLVVQTLGYLMREDEVGVTIWQEMCAEDGTSYRARSFIPKEMVVKVDYLGLRKPHKKKSPSPLIIEE